MKADFYLDFENNFRGSTDQIRNILSNYDGLIQYIIEIDHHPTLLDIGCGRGEWLKKCSDHGIKCCGIELNNDMALYCKSQGLDIIHGDAIKALKDQPDNSFSLITIFHMIEHLSFDYINLLFVECKRLLKDNGLLIIETPSIDNLSISSRLFYIDPTHINPINPDLISFTLGRIGFDMIEIIYINGGPLQQEDKYSLTRIFNGVAQDLTLVATKSKSSSHKLTRNSLWKKSFKLGLTTIEAALEFDHQLRINSINNEASIKELLAKINLLESNLQSILQSRIYKIIILISNVVQRIFARFKTIKNIIFKIILKIIRILVRLMYKVLYHYSLDKSFLHFILFSSIDRVLRYFGYRIRYGKVLKISLKKKEDIESIVSDKKMLDINYDLSLKSKRIFNDIK